MVMVGSLHAGITFSGIDGANSWAWVEGEKYSTLSGGFTGVAGLWNVSGYSSSLPSNQVNVYGYATYGVNMPMAMAGAKMYAHCSSYYIDGSDRCFNILNGDSNGTVIGTIYSGGGSGEGYKDATYWAQNGGTMGTLAQGTMQLTLKQNVYNIMCFDGFFLTNGTVDISNNAPTTASGSTDQYWMQRPTFTSLPTLTGSVTLGINGATSGERYFINGTEVTGSSFVLDKDGTYYLEVRSSDGAQSLMGAAFNLSVPEPTTLLLLLSSIGLFRRRKN
jgi:hypothetical protein